MRLSIKFVCLFSFLTIPFHTLCAAESPRAFVKNLENEMRQMMRTGNFARANEIFVDKFDIAVFSKRCLLDHWDELSPNERNRFNGLFEENLRKRMNEKMLLTKDDVDFKLTPIKIGVEEGLTRVDNRLKVRRGSFDMGILITRNGNKLRIADYDLEGALLSRNYRGHFNFIIRKYGKEGLFERMKEKLASQK